MSAAKYKLDNLTLIVDRNRLQISGGTEDVMPLDDLCDKISAFGFLCLYVTDTITLLWSRRCGIERRKNR